jgi:hypothetical protein
LVGTLPGVVGFRTGLGDISCHRFAFAACIEQFAGGGTQVGTLLGFRLLLGALCVELGLRLLLERAFLRGPCGRLFEHVLVRLNGTLGLSSPGIGCDALLGGI